MANYQANRQELMTEADHRCELWHPTFGRCSRQNCAAHHIQYRSAGGSHDKDNLVWICNQHHEDIHANVLRGPLTDDNSNVVYAQGQGDDKVLWRFWRDVEHILHQEAIQLDLKLHQLDDAMRKTAWEFAETASLVLEGSRYETLGFEDERDYAASLGQKPASLLKIVNAYRRTQALGSLGQRLRALPQSLSTEAIASFERLHRDSPLVAEEIISAVEQGDMPVTAAIYAAREEVARLSLPAEKAIATITGSVEGTFIVELEVNRGESVEDVKRKAMQHLWLHTPSWLKDKENDDRILAEFHIHDVNAG